MANGSYDFNILHEAVAIDDQFPDKTHEKVASALFRLMQTSDHGITIGLEGGWGSGKSTVVSFLKKQLASQGNDTLFFLFDAWAHEGDPLRRIFLESLIDEIGPGGDQNDLLKLRREISGRKRKVEVDTKKSTSRLGGLISLSAILVPVGAAILSAVDYSTVLAPWPWSDWGGSSHIPLITGLLLALSPAWILVYWRRWGDEGENKKGKQSWLTGKKQWDVFAADSTEKYTQDITEDGERTSVEFEHYFKQIMKYSIGENANFKRALIVIDNLDRVEPEQTLAIWSILQTFFQHRSRQKDNSEKGWQSKLWFLIPYDREGLSKVWDRTSSLPDKAESSQESTDSSNTSKMSNPRELAPSFLEKCFQVIAEVPEPVMSAWVDYCEANTRKFLVGWPEDDVCEVIETFKRVESRLDSSPTPRQTLTFINRVGFLGLRWGGEMSAEAIALYALLRKNRSDSQLRRELLHDGLPDHYEGTIPNGELKSQLAGMLFGVDKSKGIQLLLGPEIKSALNDGKSEVISSLVDKHGEAFWVVWQSIQSSSLPHGATTEYLMPVTKAFCEGVLDHKGRAASSINRLINEWKDKEISWRLYDHSEALDALLKVTPASSKPNLLSWLEKTLRQSIRDTVSSIGGDDLKLSALSNLSKAIDLLGRHDVSLPPVHYDSINHPKWKIWKDALNSIDADIACVLPAKGTIESIAYAINTGNTDTDNIRLLISTLSDMPTSEEWEQVADTLVEWGSNHHRELGNNDAHELMLRLFLKYDSESVWEKIESCVTGSAFIQKAQQEDPEQSFNLLALCAVVLESQLLSSNLGDNFNDYWQSEFNQDRCNQVIETLKNLDALYVVWLLAVDPQNKVAIGMIKNGNIDRDIYTSEEGPLHIGKYTWASDEESQEIVSKLSEYGGLGKSKQVLVDDPVKYRGCLKKIRLSGEEEGKVIVEEALRNIKADQWAETLSKDTLLFDCLGNQGNHEFKKASLISPNKNLKKGIYRPMCGMNLFNFMTN